MLVSNPLEGLPPYLQDTGYNQTSQMRFFETIKYALRPQDSFAAETTAVTIGFDVWTQKCLCVGHCVRVSGGASPYPMPLMG